MAEFKLTNKAVKDLARIWDYTFETWSESRLKMIINNWKFTHPENYCIMETKNKKDFDAVKFSRKQKDRLSEKFSKIIKEEILEYLKQKKYGERTHQVQCRHHLKTI